MTDGTPGDYIPVMDRNNIPPSAYDEMMRLYGRVSELAAENRNLRQAIEQASQLLRQSADPFDTACSKLLEALK